MNANKRVGKVGCPSRIGVLASLVVMVLPWWAISGCASDSAAVRGKSLFFRAFVEPTVPEVTSNSNKGPDDLDMEVALDSQALTQAVVAQLNERCFTACTALTEPEGKDAETFRNSVPSERDKYWVREARRRGADLLVRCEVSYSPWVQTGLNAWFVGNIFLFVIGTPASYLPPDRTYRVSVHVKTTIFDVNPSADEASDVQFFESDYGELSLSFTERATSVGWYLLSLVWPVGGLAIDNDKVKSAIEDKTAKDVADQVAAQVLVRADEFNRPMRGIRFNVDPLTVRVARAPSGKVSFGGDVVVKSDVASDQLQDYWFECDGNEISRGTFGDVPPDEKRKTRADETVYTYPMRAELPIPDGATSIRLVIRDRNDRSRSFTFPLQVGEPRS
ncbi:MAG: hypothetical protein HYR85_13370 [Planctomycetes bacterium]|nr:hypothetical protein [Planctomycetota bacterium]MBI3845895.1 hypothetical protein [Planctomycetota bacterium]